MNVERKKTVENKNIISIEEFVIVTNCSTSVFDWKTKYNVFGAQSLTDGWVMLSKDEMPPVINHMSVEEFVLKSRDELSVIHGDEFAISEQQHQEIRDAGYTHVIERTFCDGTQTWTYI